MASNVTGQRVGQPYKAGESAPLLDNNRSKNNGMLSFLCCCGSSAPETTRQASPEPSFSQGGAPSTPARGRSKTPQDRGRVGVGEDW